MHANPAVEIFKTGPKELLLEIPNIDLFSEEKFGKLVKLHHENAIAKNSRAGH